MTFPKYLPFCGNPVNHHVSSHFPWQKHAYKIRKEKETKQNETKLEKKRDKMKLKDIGTAKIIIHIHLQQESKNDK